MYLQLIEIDILKSNQGGIKKLSKTKAKQIGLKVIGNE